MSILITGMEMPKHDDEYVIFTVYGDGGVVYGPLNRPHVRYKNRAVSVPPHGRLIDADALVRNGGEYNYPLIDIDGAWDDTVPVISVDTIESAPTILEAEEGE